MLRTTNQRLFTMGNQATSNERATIIKRDCLPNDSPPSLPPPGSSFLPRQRYSIHSVTPVVLPHLCHNNNVNLTPPTPTGPPTICQAHKKSWQLEREIEPIDTGRAKGAGKDTNISFPLSFLAFSSSVLSLFSGVTQLLFIHFSVDHPLNIMRRAPKSIASPWTDFYMVYWIRLSQEPLQLSWSKLTNLFADDLALLSVPVLQYVATNWVIITILEP